ncbi:MAG: YkoF-like protein [Benniella sp.]|nr:MAG: YkoF-like protein [Benniella sp.]
MSHATATLSEQAEQRMRTGPETPLPCIADFAIYPIGTTIPFSQVIDKVEAILKQLGLKYNIHEQGTTIHGEMMAITHAIKCCHNAAHAMGCPRIVSNIRVDTNCDKYKAVEEATAGAPALPSE